MLPRCDAAVCHGGSGTTLAALTAGLPLVIIPQGADQHVNARACCEAGVARLLDAATVTSAAVRDAMIALLDPASTETEATRRIAIEIAALPSSAAVVDQLAALIPA